jgi:hypothetical protein
MCPEALDLTPNLKTTPRRSTLCAGSSRRDRRLLGSAILPLRIDARHEPNFFFQSPNSVSGIDGVGIRLEMTRKCELERAGSGENRSKSGFRVWKTGEKGQSGCQLSNINKRSRAFKAGQSYRSEAEAGFCRKLSAEKMMICCLNALVWTPTSHPDLMVIRAQSRALRDLPRGRASLFN